LDEASSSGFEASLRSRGVMRDLRLRLRSKCAERFFRKILVPGNDRVFAKNVSQIFPNRAYFSAAAEKSGKQIPFLRTNLKKAFFKFEQI